MSNRWTILALLFGLRVTMAIQFQATAALSPFMMEGFGLGLADIGLLIGFYLLPGIVFAMPGAAIGQRFGDKRTVFEPVGRRKLPDSNIVSYAGPCKRLETPVSGWMSP